MSKPTFVYVTYIRTTPEKLWHALTDPETTSLYWGHRNVSDWKVGSQWKHEVPDNASEVDVVGTVLESTPPHKLVISWADPAEASDPEKVSRVTFQIDSLIDSVRLTVIHDELEPDSGMLRGISKGWPWVLSSLKSFLETGQPVPKLAEWQ